MEINFKFEIGDMVNMVHGYRKMRIIGRSYREFIGNQSSLVYLCRDESGSVAEFIEEELVPHKNE